MPDINMQVFEEAKRNQLVTEVDIQTQVTLDDYQVQLSNIANPTQSQDNVVIDRHGEFLPHWNESSDFDTWIKTNMEIAGKRILMLRGNLNVNSESSGSDTFIQYHGAATSAFHDSNVISSACVYESKTKATAATHNIIFGLSNTVLGHDDDAFWFQSYTIPNLRYISALNEGADSKTEEAPNLTNGVWYKTRFIFTGSVLTGYVDDNQVGTNVSSNIPDENMGLFMNPVTGTMEQEYSFIRKYTAIEPTVTISTSKNISTALKSLGRTG